jgi:hypothetical protein
MGGLQDVDFINHRRFHRSDGVANGWITRQSGEEPIPLSFGQLLGIIQIGKRIRNSFQHPSARQNDRGRNHWSGQRTPTRFIYSGHTFDPRCESGSLMQKTVYSGASRHGLITPSRASDVKACLDGSSPTRSAATDRGATQTTRQTGVCLAGRI